jgi:hypothetical protein
LLVPIGLPLENTAKVLAWFAGLSLLTPGEVV